MTLIGKIFKILFWKFTWRQQLTLLCSNVVKFVWWELGEIMRYLSQKMSARLPLKLLLLCGSRPKSARANPQHLAHTIPGRIINNHKYSIIRMLKNYLGAKTVTTTKHLLTSIENSKSSISGQKAITSPTRKHRQSYRHADPRRQQHMAVAACITSNRVTVTVFRTVWPWPLTAGSMHAQRLI